MTTETTTTTPALLTLPAMQQSTPKALRALALTTDNRQYAIALDSMASAMDAYALGDGQLMRQYVETAKRAHARAHEDEYGQVMRVRQTAVAISQSSVKL